MSLHLILLASGACLFVAASTAGPAASHEVFRARRSVMIASVAMVLANGVCALPGAPAWYSVAVAALSGAGVLWALVTMLEAQHTAATAARAARVHRDAERRRRQLALATAAQQGPRVRSGSARHLSVIAGGAATGAPAAIAQRPQLSVIAGGLTDIVDAEIVDEETIVEPVGHSYGRHAEIAAVVGERAAVTRDELDLLGAPWARAQNVEVARNIRSLSPHCAERRADGSGTSARRHQLDGRITRGRIRDAYTDRIAPTRVDGSRG